MTNTSTEPGSAPTADRKHTLAGNIDWDFAASTGVRLTPRGRPLANKIALELAV